MPRKPVPPQDRLIVALDLPDHAQARDLVERLGETVTFYKIGLELFMAGDYFALIDWLTAQGKKVFADLKFYDIPMTVERAVRALSCTPVTFATVHGDPAIMAAAARGKGAKLKILAVTVLTSLDEAALKAMGYASDLETLVRRRARQAVDAGLDGVIASGREAQLLRRELGNDPLIVTPGVRPQGSPAGDQKRVVTVEEAFANGADYIVVGRPIRDAHDPKAAAAAIQRQIAERFQN
ncbi:orotidine-5'-phosphate decarboxylase [Methylomarinovum caldicuralii]|uniref:Orotidine 5'-phosphate decarboxylase n=1 Tax=Methylomarinovum caldicuralii TaxID=438856 RepID=A0AAU9BSA8_9GAMM|nr:orotidine-5'-phosphate decarboxylase [Methylomarinovum caldicuralii]BCX81738.1 orotidine-5'-phosphate decarboxylase [Methylomarinovum caldicuralii]